MTGVDLLGVGPATAAEHFQQLVRSLAAAAQAGDSAIGSAGTSLFALERSTFDARPVSIGAALIEAASQAGDLPSSDQVAVNIQLDHTLIGMEPPLDFDATVVLAGMDGPAVATFGDGSYITYPIIERQPAVKDTLDAGQALLGPITALEITAVDRMITVIGSLAAESELTEWQEAQLSLIVRILEDARNDAIPERTPRATIVGRVSAALRALFQNPFRDALALAQIVQILEKVNWHELASALRALL